MPASRWQGTRMMNIHPFLPSVSSQTRLSFSNHARFILESYTVFLKSNKPAKIPVTAIPNAAAMAII